VIAWLDLTHPRPEANLALDEALLDACEEQPEAGGVLRCYAPDRLCVVVGYGNRQATEVDLDACARAGVPVLRRASGGGTVVLGPGCLAYSLVLPLTLASELETVTGTNRWIMERQRRALEGLLGSPVAVQGFTDLTLGELKFSGNAQRRKRRAVLFHGTFLLNFDLACLETLLRKPSQEPGYRQGRRHGEFVVNLDRPAEAVKTALRREWGAARGWTRPLDGRVEALMAERYGRPEWHARW